VKDIVGQMVACGLQSPESEIQSVRYPGKGGPVGAREIEKNPFQESSIERTDMDIVRNIEVIIPVNEIILKSGKIYKKRYNGNRYSKYIF
jgi:hypothetical protein